MAINTTIKISALPEATTPLVGNESVVMAQGGNTVRATLEGVREYIGDLSGISGSDVTALSANWQNSYNTTKTLSSNWNNTYNTVKSLSSGWGGSNVVSLSANWQNSYLSVNSLSSKWNNTFNSVNSLSGKWENVFNLTNSLSSNWQNTYTGYSANSSFTVGSRIAGITGATQITNIVAITQSNYSAISSTALSTTVYVIIG